MTLRLLHLAESEWDVFDGWCASRRIVPLKLPMYRFLSLIYFWAIQYADEDQKRSFDIRLWIPPKDAEIEPESPWSAENEMGAFRDLASELNISVPPAES